MNMFMWASKKLSSHNIDIDALSKDCLSDEGHISERDAGYTFLWKEIPNGKERNGAVGFDVQSGIASQLELPQGFTNIGF
ncbi:Hypothetical predicted protein [Octopus vulgaris]|uniref:Uncharacterized protein n=1 Tax=Octopus vulgaris TaxID=6645 RepID=A0AA36BE50_OCTVU|nr:Hypothetical predicted protein [Octopus vulgaris]